MARASKVNDKGLYWCGRCKQYKSLQEFNPVPPSHRGEHSQDCKVCAVEKTYYQRQKTLLKKIGPDAYLKELEKDQERLKERYKILFKYKQETE